MSAGSYLLARYIALGPLPGPFAYWPIIGLHCGILFRRPRGEWWRISATVAASQCLAIYLVRGNLAGGATVIGAAIGSVEALLGAAILRWSAPGGAPLSRPRDFGVLAVGAAFLVSLLTTPLSAFFFAPGLSLPFRSAWWPLFIGNMLSLLVFTPLTAPPWRRPSGERTPWTAGAGEVLLCQLGTLLLSALAFAAPEQLWSFVLLPYVMFPLLAWAALRCGPQWTASSVVILATVSAWCTARVRGPFALPGMGLEQRVLAWQGYVAFAALAAGLLSALNEQRRKAFEDLALEGAIRDAVFESSSALIVLKDLEGRFVLVNRAGEAALGRPRRELVGRKPEEVVSAEWAELSRRNDRRVLERGEALTFDEPFESRGGKKTLGVTRFPVSDPHGRIRYVGIIGRDETAERELSARLQRTKRVEMLGQLAAGLAHDLNNLLSIVVGNVDLLRGREDLNEDDAAMLAEAGEAGKRASQLTRRLLAHGRKPDARKPAAEVDAVLRAIEPLLRVLARGNIDFVSELAAGDARVALEATEIEQVVLNLISNARDAITGVGQISLASAIVPASEVPLPPDRSATGRWVRLRVSDTGVGMDPPTLARLFEPFFTTKDLNGTGLGLYTTKLLVREAGGTVSASSEPGRGSTFTVALPLDEQG